jgi:TPR repeat protein
MIRTFKPFIKPFPAFAFFFACVSSVSALAGGNLYYDQPIVVAHGSPRAIGRLGFKYEHGFGVPQNYVAAADLYHRAAEQGDAFAQAQLGLMYDKGHGVPHDAVLSYKWLNLAAARASRRDRDFYLRLRDSVAMKMSLGQIEEGQRLALMWAGNGASLRP